MRAVILPMLLNLDCYLYIYIYTYIFLYLYVYAYMYVYTYIFYIFVYDKLIDFILKTEVSKHQKRHLLIGQCQPRALTFPPHLQ